MFGLNFILDDLGIGRESMKHTSLFFHRVRQAVASKMVQFHHIPDTINSADILIKHCGYSQVWDMLKLVLFWEVDTEYLL